VDKQGNNFKDTLIKIVNKNTGAVVKEARTDSNGKITIDNLVAGTYTVIPIETVTGYKIEKTSRDIVVNYDSDYTQTTYINYLLGSIEIIKKDVDNNLLDNVKFKITKRSDNTIIGTYTTDSNGRIYVPNLYSGEYIVQEIETKQGYYNDEKLNIVTVKNEDEI
jgi:uncharacterized surface anchored protein